MYSVIIRSVVLLGRSETLWSGVFGQYSVRRFVGEIKDFRVRCTRYSVSSSVGEMQDIRVRCTRLVFGQ